METETGSKRSGISFPITRRLEQRPLKRKRAFASGGDTNEEEGNPVTKVEGGKEVKLEGSLNPTLIVGGGLQCEKEPTVYPPL